MTSSTEAKRKSARRFEQLNLIVDTIAPTLKSASHVAVLMVCYRHADPNGRFRASKSRIALACNLSVRQTVRVMKDLEVAGVIVKERDHDGPIPQRYRITGETARVKKTEKNLGSVSPPPSP